MSTLSGIDKWAEEHRSVWIDFLRILLGIFLIAKGASLVSHREQIEWLLVNHHLEFLIFIASVYVVLFHIGGGILIATGLITRWATAFQIPILLGAVFFVNLPKGFTPINSELGYSIAVLVLLIFFLFYGSGDFSLDSYLKKHNTDKAAA
jgi:putative oxidoreductase